MFQKIPRQGSTKNVNHAQPVILVSESEKSGQDTNMSN